MAHKASSTPLFLVCILQKCGKPTRPAHHVRSPICNSMQVHMFHNKRLQEFLIIGIGGICNCSPSTAQDNPISAFQHYLL